MAVVCGALIAAQQIFAAYAGLTGVVSVRRHNVGLGGRCIYLCKNSCHCINFLSLNLLFLWSVVKIGHHIVMFDGMSQVLPDLADSLRIRAVPFIFCPDRLWI